MQYEIVIKVIGVVHVILAFLVLLLLLLKVVRRRLLWVLALGLLRWISFYSRTHGQNNTQQYAYTQILTKTKKQYINT